MWMFHLNVDYVWSHSHGEHVLLHWYFPDIASAEESEGIRPEFVISALEKLYPRTACGRR